MVFTMAQAFRLLVSPALHDTYGPAFREAGLECEPFRKVADALQANADGVILDLRRQEERDSLPSIQVGRPLVSLVSDSASRTDLHELKKRGARHIVSDRTPASELALRLLALLNEARDPQGQEFRGSRRIWFQQEIEFQIFDQSHRAWSTTLSESGIFLRTNLSFPLYSTLKLKFHLLGDMSPFECQGVIVRQEVEGPIRGLGVMFQSLSGEQIRMLESFLDLCR